MTTVMNGLLKQAKSVHLSHSTLHFSQEVSFLQTAVFAVDVVHFKLQLLHHLKVVVDDKLLGEAWIKAVVYFLCPANLTQTHVTGSDTAELWPTKALPGSLNYKPRPI